MLYGSDAIGGVINVIEPDLPDGIGRAPFVQGSVTGGFASGNRQPDGSLTLEGASSGFGYRASLTGRHAENTRTPTYTLWNSGFHNVGGTGTLGYRGAWGHRPVHVPQRPAQLDRRRLDGYGSRRDR